MAAPYRLYYVYNMKTRPGKGAEAARLMSDWPESRLGAQIMGLLALLAGILIFLGILF